MDKIDKALRRLSEKERASLKVLLERIIRKETKGLDIKKLRGRDDIYRARKSDLRVIYRVEGKRIYLLAIERRNDTTYG